ncbi:MAG: shikimate kinase [Pseudomonadota bacterium]|nr:shikimate kinase [Pseudomonadota bacterium]
MQLSKNIYKDLERIYRSHNAIALIGAQGVGKTTVGKQLALDVGAEWLDTDHLMINYYNKRFTANVISAKEIYKQLGSRAFRDLEREVIATIDFTKPDLVVSMGGGSHLFQRSLKLKKEATFVLLFRFSDFFSLRGLLRLLSGYFWCHYYLRLTPDCYH